MSVWSDELTAACALGISTETLSAWRDDELNPELARRIAQHTPTCRACAERLALFDAISDDLRRSRAPLPRPTLWNETRRRILNGDAQSARGSTPAPFDAPAMLSQPWGDDAQGGASQGERRESRSRVDGKRNDQGRSGAPPSRSMRRVRRIQRRWGLISGAIAATLITALLVGLLLSRGAHGPANGPTPTANTHTPIGTLTGSTTPGATTTASGTPQRTVGPTQTPGPPGLWQPLAGMAGLPAPTIAPSNPNIVYFLGAGTTKATANQYYFERSEDGGVTLQQVTFPQYNGQPISSALQGGSFYLLVNPINAQTIYFVSQLYGSACGGAATLRRAQDGQRFDQTLSSGICNAQFVSENGGASWTTLTLPAAGLFGLAPSDGNRTATPLRVQGARIFALVTDTALGSSGVPPGGRLIVSADGGVSWSLADAPIAAAGLQVLDFAPTPNGSTVFVASENPNSMQTPPYQQQPNIWRSDNAGASWVNLGAPPAPGTLSEAAVADIAAGDTANGQPFVFLEVTSSTKGAATLIDYSENGGVNWQAVPSASSLGDTPLGTLANGSLVARFTDGSFHAWAPGNGGWTQIAPADTSVTANATYLLAASDGIGDGRAAILAIDYDNSGTLIVNRVIL